MEWTKKISNVVFCISSLVAIITGFLLLYSLSSDLRGMLYWRSIAKQKENSGDWTGQGILPQYQSLYNNNPDIVGWLSIEGKPNYLDYPVMQTKNDPEHYLRRNFDGEDDWSGAPFADYRCDIVPVKGFNTVIYGHDGSFSWLYDYEYKGWRMYQNYPYIRFDTLNEEALYEIAAVFYMDARNAVLIDPWDANDPLAYECYNYLEVDSPEGFRKYLERVEEERIYEANAKITIDSHVITLICCAREPYSGIAETEGAVNGRLVVIAVQVE